MTYYRLVSPDLGENIHMKRASHSDFHDTAGQFVKSNDIEPPFLVDMHAGEDSGYDQFDIDFVGEAEQVPVSERLKDFYTTAPLMSSALIQTLLDAGVDNLQLFPVVVRDAATGAVLEKQYQFFNIVGLISCANIEASEHAPIGSTFYFHDLVIDETKANGALMFRLAESPFEIIVAEQVAKAINNGGFKGITAEPLEAL